jgi:hypothetical protein
MFSYTGVPSLTGGYAYPPGSPMTLFMDQLNASVANASSAASGLGGAQQQQGGGSPQMMGMMFKMLMTLLQKKLQGTNAQNADDSPTENATGG